MSTTDRPRPLLTIRETAEYLHVSVSTVRRMLEEGDLNGYKVKGQLRIPWDAIEKYLASRSLRGRGKVPRLK